MSLNYEGMNRGVAPRLYPFTSTGPAPRANPADRERLDYSTSFFCVAARVLVLVSVYWLSNVSCVTGRTASDTIAKTVPKDNYQPTQPDHE